MELNPGAIKTAFENALLRLIPFVGDSLADLTPDQRRAFLVLLAEAIARGAAEGAMRGNKEKTQ